MRLASTGLALPGPALGASWAVGFRGVRGVRVEQRLRWLMLPNLVFWGSGVFLARLYSDFFFPFCNFGKVHFWPL